MSVASATLPQTPSTTPNASYIECWNDVLTPKEVNAWN